MRSSGKLSVVAAAFLVVALCALLLVALASPHRGGKDLVDWLALAKSKDWSSEAAQNQPQAQFLLGLSLIQTNLIIMIDRVPELSSVPVIGRRFFETKSCMIQDGAPQAQIEGAYAWIQKAVDQGYPPAKEALKLFTGKVGQR